MKVLSSSTKFRLVGCGYSQVEGLDYFETHAGTVSMVVVRIMMAAIAAMNLHTRLFDIGTAFLEGELQEGLPFAEVLPCNSNTSSFMPSHLLMYS